MKKNVLHPRQDHAYARRRLLKFLTFKFLNSRRSMVKEIMNFINKQGPWSLKTISHQRENIEGGNGMEVHLAYCVICNKNITLKKLVAYLYPVPANQWTPNNKPQTTWQGANLRTGLLPPLPPCITKLFSPCPFPPGVVESQPFSVTHNLHLGSIKHGILEVETKLLDNLWFQVSFIIIVAMEAGGCSYRKHFFFGSPWPKLFGIFLAILVLFNKQNHFAPVDSILSQLMMRTTQSVISSSNVAVHSNRADLVSVCAPKLYFSESSFIHLLYFGRSVTCYCLVLHCCGKYL